MQDSVASVSNDRTARNMRKESLKTKSRTWCRDGFLVTNDSSMMDLASIRIELGDSDALFAKLDISNNLLVILTPTPWGNCGSTQIRFALLQNCSTVLPAPISKLGIAPPWKDQELEQWLMDCAETLQSENWSNDDGAERSNTFPTN